MIEDDGQGALFFADIELAALNDGKEDGVAGVMRGRETGCLESGQRVVDPGLDLPRLDGGVGPLYLCAGYTIRKGGYQLQKGEAVVCQRGLGLEMEVAVLAIGKVGRVEVGAAVRVSSIGRSTGRLTR